MGNINPMGLHTNHMPHALCLFKLCIFRCGEYQKKNWLNQTNFMLQHRAIVVSKTTCVDCILHLKETWGHGRGLKAEAKPKIVMS